MSPTARVLTGLGAGALLGIVFTRFQPGLAQDLAAVGQPIGDLWLNALQMTVVPLVAALVVIGINHATDAAASGRTARNAIVTFVVILSVCAAFAAIVAPILFSLVPRQEGLADSLRAATAGAAQLSLPPRWPNGSPASSPAMPSPPPRRVRCCRWWCSRCSSASP